MGQSALALDQVHLLLQLLLVVEGDLIRIPIFLLHPPEAPKVRMLVDLFWLLVGVFSAVLGREGRQKAVPGEDAMCALGWDSAYRKPIVSPVDVHRNVSFDSLSFFELPCANMIEEFASEILFGWLNE